MQINSVPAVTNSRHCATGRYIPATLCLFFQANKGERRGAAEDRERQLNRRMNDSLFQADTWPRQRKWAGEILPLAQPLQVDRLPS